MKKKRQETSSSEEQKAIRSMYDLPIGGKIVRNKTGSGCVIKSWRWPSSQCTTTLSRRPTLVEVDVDVDGTCTRMYDIDVDCRSWCKIGHLEMVVTGDCSPAFVYNSSRSFYAKPYRSRGYCCYKPHWILKHCNINEPYAPSQKMRFCKAISFEGRFYAMSLQGSVAVIEEEVGKGFDRLGITRIGGNRAVPSEATSRHFREYMFESDGQILVVLLISRESIEVVDDVEVFRLDIEKLLWVKMEKIGNRALFLDDRRCTWAESCEIIKRDCIYFAHNWVDDWMVFNMKTREILPADFGEST